MSFYDREFSLPVRPNLEQLRNQAKDLLHDLQAGVDAAVNALDEYHPESVAAVDAKLADARLVVARRYGVASWARLKHACDLTDAIWRDEIDEVRSLVTKFPNLVHEPANGSTSANCGPPMSYAAGLGRDEVIKMFADLGAVDFEGALEQAARHGNVDTGILLHKYLGSPTQPEGALAGMAYTLNEKGTAFALRAGAPVLDERGKYIAPVDLVLETDARVPTAKHAILQMYAAYGVEYPDTAVMALHRGRIDLIEDHLRRDPQLLSRTFTHEDIYPPDFGCHDEILATQGTPLAGTTLLHLSVDYDEFEIAEWLIANGADVNVRSAIDADGFGGYTPLFNTVMSQPNFWKNYSGGHGSTRFTELFLEHGAEVSVRASVRKKLHPGYSRTCYTETWYEYRNLTALEYADQFHARVFVDDALVKLIKRAASMDR
jgi:hypothetical protein